MTTSYRNLIECQTEQQRIRALLEACEARLAAVEAERDSLIDQIADAGKKVQALTAERDAARAGEARAVEACSEMENALHGTDLGEHGWDDPIWNALEEMREISRDNSALDWLAQREREAAAVELEGMSKRWCCDESYRPNFPELWRFVFDRAAALRAGKGGE